MEKGRKFFSILLIISVIITIGLLGYLAYNYISNYITNKEASDIVDEFESIITVAIEDEEPENNIEDTHIGENTNNNSNSNTSKVQVRYRGYNVIGTIQIPKTGAKYPIIDNVSPSAMESGIVMLYGKGLNEIGNTVLVGHNYRNGGFFGNNKKLQIGDKINITSLSGQRIEYTIYYKAELPEGDFSYANRTTNGKREISLSTCTSNNDIRLVIWAKED